MGKLLIGVLCGVACVSLPTEGKDMGRKKMQPSIGCNPSTPTQGKKATITYTGTLPVTLDLDWDPAGEPSTVTITKAGGTEITVPANATSLVISDPNGSANDLPVVINPS